MLKNCDLQKWFYFFMQRIEFYKEYMSQLTRKEGYALFSLITAAM
ncbi:hypothetical protein VIBNIAM115_560029 [Vibrio nigripulchritudo AM115]|nr:hypothetical protein VIBNIAM115_560029 [Vibrio nigripulchritudo AM115]